MGADEYRGRWYEARIARARRRDEHGRVNIQLTRRSVLTRQLELQAALGRQFSVASRSVPALDRRPLATALGTAASGLLVYLVILLTGGTPTSLGHMAYIPIVFAAYRAGARGGLLAALIGAVMLGPVMYITDLQHNGEFGWPWLVRAVFFLGVGGTTGWLFGRCRVVTAAWREAALEVAERHHESMATLAAAAEAKDPTTGDHMYRCRDLAGALAGEAGLDGAAVADIAWSAMLHDIGKLYVPDAVLTKPGPLDPEEWELVREHPSRGAQLLEGTRSFDTARRIARWHHENLDGSGYPDGLRGSVIPLEARIVRVVDAWDAMVNDRPYRRALALDRAMQELRDGAGAQFDPELVALFLAMAEDGRLPLFR